MNFQKPRILAIDDTPVNLMTLGEALKHEFDLQLATSGAQGIALARQTPPDLILLDIMMPDMDGFETCRSIKADPQLKDIPVVFITAANELDSEITGLELGALDYITKPIQVETARQRIRNLVERERLRQQVIKQRDQLEADILERQATEEKLKLAASVFASAHEGIAITNKQGDIIDVNASFTRITGYSRDEVIGKSPQLLNSGRQNPAFYEAMWHQVRNQGHWCGEIWNRRKNGQIYAEMLNITAVLNTQGATQNYVALFSDITTLKEHEQELDRIAHHDGLTGMPNRALLGDRLRQGMNQAQRRGQQLAVVFIDLDGFKIINDTHGHETGDQLLVTLAKRMKQTLRDGDTLARFGGDEFVVVMVDLNDRAASMPLLNRLLEAAAQPVQVGDITLQVTASLGVTYYPQSADTDGEQLLRQADQAMYQAKLAGKNRYQLFSPT